GGLEAATGAGTGGGGDGGGGGGGGGSAGATTAGGAVTGCTRSVLYALTEPTLPAGSMARTSKGYIPAGWPVRSYVVGLLHAVQSETTVPSRSRRHCRLAPGSPMNVNVTVGSVVDAGGPASTSGATGAVVSRT